VTSARVYIVDDDPAVHEMWRRLLPAREFDLEAFLTSRDALEALERDPSVDVVVTALEQPSIDGAAIVARIRAERPEVEVLVVGGFIEGAFGFLRRPFTTPEVMRLAIRRAVERRRLVARVRVLERELAERRLVPQPIVGGPTMNEVRRLAATAAASDAPVLVVGEPGTGRHLVAGTIGRGEISVEDRPWDGVKIVVPPLRERGDDVALLAYHFLARELAHLGREPKEIAPDALAALAAWRWPGNVRELEDTIARAASLARGRRIELHDLPGALVATSEPPEIEVGYARARAQAIQRFEKAYVEALLARTDGNLSEAARLAGLDRSNFKRIVKRTGK
jgi:DNA-binding NtrC family response regulator